MARLPPSACTKPTRCTAPSVLDQSTQPAAAVGSAKITPRPTNRLPDVALARQVEEKGAGPAPDRQVGQGRVKRVAQ